MNAYVHCTVCNKRLSRVALFCPTCSEPCCSWYCHAQHLARHLKAARPAADKAKMNSGPRK